LELYAVEAKEINGPKTDSVKWRLLTTIPVTNFEEAIEIVNKYRHRWYIEQVFRLLKKQGFRIEDSELTTGWAIRKLTILLFE
jgi:transposase